MNLNDVWMRRDEEFDFSTIDEETQNQMIEIRTSGIRICPNAYCLRQPSGFVSFLFFLFFLSFFFSFWLFPLLGWLFV